MFVHPIDRIYCGAWNDIQVMSTDWADNLLLPNTILENSHIKISWDIKSITLWKFEISELKKGINWVVWSKKLKIQLFWLRSLRFNVDSNISSFEIWELKIENSVIEWWELKDTKIHRFMVKNTLFRGVNFYNIIFPKDRLDFILHRSSFSGCAFSNVDWGNGINDKDYLNGEIKETYRMLKYEYDEIWNKTEANKFFAKEMEYHMKDLEQSWNKKDYWIARLQKEVSNFGNDWVRALIVYLAFVTFWFICSQMYQIFQPDLFIDLSWRWFFNWMEDLTRSANPIPKVEDITNIFSLLFSIWKILIVYQIVVALRRISQR